MHTFLFRLPTKKPSIDIVPLSFALNRILAEKVTAKEDLPRFDRSAVDGYAVKASDTFEASQFKPKILQITNEREISGKQAKRVWTGNPVPKGADAVVMLENTKQLDNKLEVLFPVTPWENVSKRGEDVREGEVAVEAGSRLKPQHLGLIAGLGVEKVKVFEKPRIAILATGNELVNAGEKPEIDQIFEANRPVLSALCLELGAEPVDLGIGKDDVEEIAEKIQTGIETADAIITSGGTSVGAFDFVPEAISRIGKPGILVHGIAMRPAMPTALAIVEKKPIIVLSGNPVAAMMGFEVFVRPVICKLLGLAREEQRPIVKAKILKRVTTALGRKTFIRVCVYQRDDLYLAEPISTRGSGVISTMTKANGYVVVSENREGLEEGEVVSVHLFDSVEMVVDDV